jgi:predicted oxidoreductase
VTTARREKDTGIRVYAKSGLYEDNKFIVDTCETIAKARGISMAQVALAWTLSKEHVSAPIVGTTSLNNLKELVGMLRELHRIWDVYMRLVAAVHIMLTDDEIKALEEGYKPRNVVGHS